MPDVTVGRVKGTLELDSKRFSAGAKKAGADLRKLDGGMQKTSSSAQSLGSSISSVRGQLIAVAASVTAVVLIVKKLTDAANVQEAALNKLTNALMPLGDQAIGTTTRLTEYASELQAVTTFGDEIIIQGQSLVAAFNKNEDVIKAATKAALDLSAATGTELKSAFLLLGRAAAGETSMLSRYGIVLDKGIPKSEKFAAAIKKINEMFGGAASAAVITYAGQLQQVSNAFGDILEGLGSAITQSELFRDSAHNLRLAVMKLRIELGGEFLNAEELTEQQLARSRESIEKMEASIESLRTRLDKPAPSMFLQSLLAAGAATPGLPLPPAMPIDRSSTELEITQIEELIGLERTLAENLAKRLEMLKKNTAEGRAATKASDEQVKAGEKYNAILEQSRLAVERIALGDKAFEAKQVEEALRVAGEAAGISADEIQRGLDTLQEQRAVLGEITEAEQARAEADRAIAESESARASEIQSATARISSTLTGVIQQAMQGLATMQDVMARLAQTIVDIVLQKLVEVAVDSALELLGLAKKTTAEAQLEVEEDITKQKGIQLALTAAMAAFGVGGGGVTAGGVVQAAAGGIVTQPTFLLAGEAGPEAIIPLDRLKDIGRSGVVVNVNNESGGEVETRERRGPGGEQIIDVIVKRVAQNITDGGVVQRALEARNFIRRRGVQR